MKNKYPLITFFFYGNYLVFFNVKCIITSLLHWCENTNQIGSYINARIDLRIFRSPFCYKCRCVKVCHGFFDSWNSLRRCSLNATGFWENCVISWTGSRQVYHWLTIDWPHTEMNLRNSKYSWNDKAWCFYVCRLVIHAWFFMPGHVKNPGITNNLQC